MNAKVKEAIEVIMQEINDISSAKQTDVALTIVDTVRNQHRTQQEDFWTAMLRAQIMYADSRYDLRNEAAVNWAKLVKEVVANNMDMGLPRI